MATGAVHKNLGVPGEEELKGRGVSYCATCDGPFFRNKKIVVIGGGDSACSEAIYLATLSKDVTIVHRRNEFRAQKALVDKMLKAGVKPVYDCVVKQINGQNKVESITLENVKTGERKEFRADTVLLAMGLRPRFDLVDALRHSCPETSVAIVGDCNNQAGAIAEAVNQAFQACLHI